MERTRREFIRSFSRDAREKGARLEGGMRLRGRFGAFERNRLERS